MKTKKILFLALVVSAVLAVSAKAGNHHGNSGSEVAPGPAGSSGRSVSSASGLRYGGGRMIAPSQRFSSIGMRSMSSGYRPYYTGGPSLGQRRFTPGAVTPGNGLARFENSRTRNLGAIQSNRVNHTGSLGNGNTRGLAGGSNHVFAQRSASWHRDWDRGRDHFWNGHRCRFVNGSWFIFDLGFFPWYGFPYDYYGYGSYYPYPYGYGYGYWYGYGYGSDPGAYQGGNYYDQGGYDSSDQNADSTVAGAQDKLARRGYYRGQIDGVFGPATRRAVTRYQRDN